MHFVHSPLALPGVLVVIPLVFHAILLALGCSLAEAADQGWVQQPQVSLSEMEEGGFVLQWLCCSLHVAQSGLGLELA